jgi:hypothetical protein
MWTLECLMWPEFFFFNWKINAYGKKSYLLCWNFSHFDEDCECLKWWKVTKTGVQHRIKQNLQRSFNT